MRIFTMALFILAAGATWSAPEDSRVAKLAVEVADKGWIAYSARSENGTWDLFVSRPDGSQRRNITSTPGLEEAGPRWSPDGAKLLYRVLPAGTTVHHDRWGFQGRLAIAAADGANSRFYGSDGDYAWASWSPDGTELVCLTLKEIQVVDFSTMEVIRRIPRNGVYQMLYWSPDGKSFCGVANHQDSAWTVVRLDAETGVKNIVRTFQNCTPDWSPDGKRIIFSSRPGGQPGASGYGYTQLWSANWDGSDACLLYGEDGAHVYGGAYSPDGAYLLFTRGTVDGGDSQKAGAPICLMRRSDAPTIGGESPDLRRLHPDAKDGPVLELVRGWEPTWTYHDVLARAVS